MIVGNTIVDGNVTWKVVNDQNTPSTSAGGGGNNGILYSNSPVGSILPYAVNDSLPDGYLICNGAEVLTDEYPELFSVIGDTFGTASDEYHFVLPDLRDKFIEGSTNAGDDIDAGLPNIKGQARPNSNTGLLFPGAVVSGAFGVDDVARTYSPAQQSTGYDITFDASRSSQIYGASDTVQPPAVTMIYIIKAINTIEIFENIQDENYTIIYPNNGTEESPANVATGSTYVLENPFPGYAVDCQAEIYYNGEWGIPYFMNHGSSKNNGTGVYCFQHNDDTIILKTGDYALVGTTTTNQYNAYPSTWTSTFTTSTTPLPCRVKVWKVNAINNTPVVKKTEVNVNRVDYAEGQSWCYIYPNNGSKESPANIVNATRYVLENPFPGYLVQCIVYLLYNNNWFEPSYVNFASNSNAGYGTKASLFNESQIIVQTGSISIDIGGQYGGSGLGSAPYSSNPASLPCRVLVYKVGKLPE